MLKPLGIIAGWAGATVAVIALGWSAVGAVTGAVTDPPELAQPPLDPVTAGEQTPSPPGEPPPSPAPEEHPATRTFDMAGGTVGVRTGAAAVELLFAAPRPGFSVDVRSRGPSEVEVRFSSDAHESRFSFDLGGGERLEERAG